MNRVFLKSCEEMSEIADGAVQTCVTSPPYYGLRDYGVAGQIGLEPSLEEYVSRLVTVFREVRRVLRDDGVLWLNLGDSYAGSPSSVGYRPGIVPGEGGDQFGARNRNGVGTVAGLKPKDLIGVPWTVAFALRADGWWLRDAIVWAKPSCMPSSVTDRCTPSYEMIFMLTKRARYFSDMNAIKEPLADETLARISQAKWKAGTQGGSARGNGGAKANGPMRAVVNAKGSARPPQLEDGPEHYDLAGANKRNVWTIAAEPYSEAHFATFPIELPSLCIRAGSRAGDLVLDPFMGSGTTAQAAESLGRLWVGYELNSAYHALIAERTRQTGLFSA